MHLRDSVIGVRDEDKETDELPMSAAGKKRQLIGSGGGTRKKPTISSSHEKPYSLRSFLKPMDRGTGIGTGAVAGTAFDFDSGDETATQLVEVKHAEQTGTLILDDSADESDPVCSKRKRSLRLKAQNQLSSVKEESMKVNLGACSKRRRADAHRISGEQDREPSVILAWKHWCMYEEDGEEIDVLVNKRDERRRLERQNELQRQEQNKNVAGNIIWNSFYVIYRAFFYLSFLRIIWL